MNAYLQFNGACREAMEFYRNCFGGELFLQTVAESPVAAQCPESLQNGVMHAQLAGDGFMLMGSDMGCNNAAYQPGSNFSLLINCSSEAQLHTLFNRLSDGGQVFQPLQKQFWGALFGQLTDRFGTHWMLSYEAKTAVRPGAETVLEEQ